MTPSPSPSFFMHQLHLWAANRCSNSSKPHIYSEHPPRKRGGFCHQHSKYKYLGLTMSGVTFSPFHTYQWLWLNKWELGLPWTNQAHPWSLRWGSTVLEAPELWKGKVLTTCTWGPIRKGEDGNDSWYSAKKKKKVHQCLPQMLWF